MSELINYSLVFISCVFIGFYVTKLFLDKYFPKRINLTTTHLDGSVTKERLSKEESKAIYELIDKYKMMNK